MLEHAFGRPQEQATPTEDPTLPTNAGEAESLSWVQLQIMAARVLGELPTDEADTETATITNAVPATVTENGTMK